MTCFLPRFGRQGACHDITKFGDSQTKKQKQKKPGNDCMTEEILQKRYSNEWLQTQDLREKKVLEKVQIGLRWC